MKVAYYNNPSTKLGQNAVLLLFLITLLSRVWVARASVEVTNFQVGWENGVVRLTWETESELNHLGFYLWRTSNSSADFTAIPPAEKSRLNEALIVGEGGVGTGRYAWEDQSAEPTSTYYYWLESLDSSNTAAMIGPVSPSKEGEGIGLGQGPTPIPPTATLISATAEETAPTATPLPLTTALPTLTAIIEQASVTPAPSATEGQSATPSADERQTTPLPEGTLAVVSPDQEETQLEIATTSAEAGVSEPTPLLVVSTSETTPTAESAEILVTAPSLEPSPTPSPTSTIAVIATPSAESISNETATSLPPINTPSLQLTVTEVEARAGAETESADNIALATPAIPVETTEATAVALQPIEGTVPSTATPTVDSYGQQQRNTLTLMLGLTGATLLGLVGLGVWLVKRGR